MFETDAHGEPVEVADLDRDALLDLLEQRKLGARAAERGKLRLAAQWCVVNPATADTGTATWAGASMLGGDLDADESLGGDGTPAVSAFAAEPVAAALGVSTVTGMALIADALDLQHRLPRIWRLVEALAVEPYKARHVAQATHKLSREAAAYVDQALADRLPSCSWTTIETAVAHAIAKYHPELLAEREKTGKKSWHVTLQHPAPSDYAGTSYLDIAGDTLDLTAFHDLVCDQAAALKALGDTDDLEIRKAKALGVIASQQAQLDLTTLLTTDDGRATARTGPGAAAEAEGPALPPPHPRRPRHRLHREPGRRRDGRRRDRGEARRGHPRADQGLGRPLQRHHPARPRHDPRRRRRRPRATRLDARARHPPRPPLRLPLVPAPRPELQISTTSTPTSPWTKADHPARRTPGTSPPCVDDTTGARPQADGATDEKTTAPTSGTAPTAGPTSSPRPAPSSSPSTEAPPPAPPARTRQPDTAAGPPARPGTDQLVAPDAHTPTELSPAETGRLSHRGRASATSRLGSPPSPAIERRDAAAQAAHSRVLGARAGSRT